MFHVIFYVRIQIARIFEESHQNKIMKHCSYLNCASDPISYLQQEKQVDERVSEAFPHQVDATLRLQQGSYPQHSRCREARA